MGKLGFRPLGCSDHDAKNRRLKRELARMIEERDIL